MSAKLTRSRLGAFKSEGTYGTAETLLAADAATRLYNLSVNLDSNFVERDAQGAMGRSVSVVGQRSGNASFTTYLHGKGSAGVPHHGQLWESCGMVLTSQSYATSDTTTSWKGLSISDYVGGFRKRLRGAMGNATLRFVPGEQVAVDWSFVGGFIENVTDTTILSGITYETPSAMPPTWAGSARLTLASGTSYKVGSCTIDLGNAVSVREDQNATGGTIGGFIGDRVVRVTLDPEAIAIATLDWGTYFSAGTTFDLVCVVGTASNNIVTVTASGLQLAAEPNNFGDRNGKLTQQLECIGQSLTVVYS
jgi:hypothetical protein